jgi:biopolymer transport protein ExbD
MLKAVAPLVVVLVACGGTQPGQTEPGTTPTVTMLPQRAQATTFVARADVPPKPAHPFPDVALARSTSTKPVPRNVPVLEVDMQAIRWHGRTKPILAIGPDGVRDGIAAKHKRLGPNDLFVVTLADALPEAGALTRHPGELVLLVDHRVTYRVLFEVLYTAGQQKISTFHLAVNDSNGRARVITMRAPHVPPPGSPPQTVAPIALVVSGGVAIKAASGDNVATGCDTVGRSLAVPDVGGKRDVEALRSCATKLKRRAGTTHTPTVVVIANPGVRFSEIVSVIDALRTDDKGMPLFPDVLLSVARW